MNQNSGRKLYLGFAVVLVLLVIGGFVALAQDGSDADAASESPTDLAITELRAETRELRHEIESLTRQSTSLGREIEAISGGEAAAAAEHGAAVPAADRAAAADADAAPADAHATPTDAHDAPTDDTVAASHDADAGDDDADAADHGGAAPHWTYDGATDGPAAWGTLSPDFVSCASGERQSPINIASTVRIGLTDAVFHYGPSDLTIVNNGHTVQANVVPGYYIELDGERYDLLQFHFHVPSEHVVKGESFAMEMHFVHASAAGELAVVGVLFASGAANAVLAPIWSVLPANAGDEATLAAFNLPALLPSDRTAYRYSGSLTTPPCSEDVKWSVLRGSLTVAPAQAQAFSDLIGANNRPIQPVNTREILEDVAAG